MLPKRVIKVINTNRRLKTKQLEPMDRPVTPKIDERNNVNNNPMYSSVTSLYDTKNFSRSLENDDGSATETANSAFKNVTALLADAKSPEEISAAVQSFSDTCKDISNSRMFTSNDINDYKKYVLPHLQRIYADKTSSPKVLLYIFKGLRCVAAHLASHPRKSSRQSSDANSQKLANKLGLKPKLGPLKRENEITTPTSSEKPQNPKEPEQKKDPSEHFYTFMSHILCRLSTNQSNDRLFDSLEMASFICNLTGAEHEPETRCYGAAILKNATNKKEFCMKLLDSPSFNTIFSIFDMNSKEAGLGIGKLTSVFRNLMADVDKKNYNSTLKKLAESMLHVKLIDAIMKKYKSEEIVYNSFSILTKLVIYDDIRGQILQKFNAKELVTVFLNVLKLYQKKPEVVSRVCYSYAYFAAQEPEFLDVPPNINDDINISILSELLVNEELMKGKESSSLIIQLIANLSVDKKYSDIFSISPNIPPLFERCTYAENDRFGLNLLCAASNFTYHHSQWCPAEMISSIPSAIISKNLPVIIETLRILCNVALYPNPQITDSKIPELLVILLEHPSLDIQCYSLQTLTNLVFHGQIGDRFRAANGVELVKKILDGNELDEAIVEASCKLIMNFGAISVEEAKEFITIVDLFEEPKIATLNMFRDFLKKKTYITE